LFSNSAVAMVKTQQSVSAPTINTCLGYSPSFNWHENMLKRIYAYAKGIMSN
jgi:hypothetical protein